LKPIVNEAYPGLEDIPWVELGTYPTRVQAAPSLGEAWGVPELYVKRDDQSCPLYGGNKVRKLEYLLADAEEKNRETLITIGACGSNQVLATGILGGSRGFKVVGVVMDQPNAEYVRRNLLLDHRYGVELVHAGGTLSELYQAAKRYVSAALRGEKPYFITAGASSPRGNLGYVNAAFEFREQIDRGKAPRPDYVVVAAGSMGTAAGLTLGLQLAGLDSTVLAVRVAMPWMVNEKRMRRMAQSLNRFMQRFDSSVPTIPPSRLRVRLLGDYLGEGYACHTPLALRCLEEAWQLEGLSLDPTYTSKALAGGLDWIKGRGEEGKTVLFWNTYNSVELDAGGVSPQELPKGFQKYFATPTQEEESSFSQGMR